MTGSGLVLGCCSKPKYYGPDGIYEVIEGLSYTRGRHNFKVGGEFRRTASSATAAR